jgi:transglutaminase-like putative cysteine protease
MAPWSRVALLATCLAALPAAAEAADAPDLPVRAEKLHVSYVLNPDGSCVETREQALKVLREQGIEFARQRHVSYSTSVERADVLEAYTRKADGRRVEVPKSNYQLHIDRGREDGSPAFSDRTQLTVVFPDVAAGDVVVLKYRVTETEPMFPGRFSVDERFNRMAAYDDVRVRIDAPAALWSQHAVKDMAQARDETRDGRRILEWSWKNPTPAKAKRRDDSVYDPEREPGYAYSTFRTYREIAEAYGDRARPKAAVTDRARRLAIDVVGGAKEPREQARLLYEWVAAKIEYAGNCIGVGAVVPRDQAFVLDNHMGDCKDKATLLQALLAAQGIESTQALVNSGSMYRLPGIPVVSMVNHVIVYVPSFDLYLDPTSRSTPFGMLPIDDSDKPVLLVDGYRDGIRTPPLKSSANRQVAKSRVTLKPDGSVAGTIEVSSSGLFATSGRERLRDMTAQQKDEFLERLYRRDNKTGFGRLESDDPKPMRDTFSYKITFETEEFARVPGPGAFVVSPLYATEAPIEMLAASTDEEEAGEEFACFGGTVVEEYVYELPKGMKVLAVPKDVSLSSGATTYRATYSLEGETLTVRREMVDETDRNVCPIAVQREFAKLARKIATDLKAQVVYE